MKKQKPQLIVALDVGTLAEARSLIDTLYGIVDIFKVGSRLFTACGPVAVRFIEARGKKVFLDLKYHDIPNTVAGSVQAAVQLSEAVQRNAQVPLAQKKGEYGLFMYTVHTSGGPDMMKAAADAANKEARAKGLIRPLAVGVTVLTSEEKKDNILTLVLEKARLAKESGLDGVVASPGEAKMIRRELGEKFIIVTPGIRPAGAEAADQKRVATPSEAIKNGSDYLVVGRPIIEARDPFSAAQKILEEIDKA
ncbi:MAG: orotidine-5'-phosphate decarboxylase [Candidatus Omnitrophota bacterium]